MIVQVIAWDSKMSYEGGYILHLCHNSRSNKLD